MVAALDLETTGLPVRGDFSGIEILEIACVVHNGPVFQTYVKPTKPIPQAAINVHKITEKVIADGGGTSLPVAIAALKDFIAEQHITFLVGHNIKHYDLPILKCAGFEPDATVIDTLIWARAAYPDLRTSLPDTFKQRPVPRRRVSHSLDALCGDDRSLAAHTAVADCGDTLKVWQHLHTHRPGFMHRS